jgi:hypothetical protein
MAEVFEVDSLERELALQDLYFLVVLVLFNPCSLIVGQGH